MARDLLRIYLNDFELLHISHMGCTRVVRNRGNQHKYGMRDEDSWNYSIEGTCAEAALAKFRGIYWMEHGDPTRTDVGHIHEVRTTVYRTGFMTMHPKDKDDKIYWLLTGFKGDYMVRGWLWGRDCKQQKWWRDPQPGRFCFCVPQSALRSPTDSWKT